MRVLLTGAFRYTREQLKQIQSLGVDIIYIEDERIPLKIDVSDIDAVICNGLFRYNDITLFPNLKYIQLTSAGYDRVPMDYITNHNIRIENAKGIYSTPIAEWVILKILEIYKKSREFYLAQSTHQWVKHHDLLELYGKTAVIVGVGSVGLEVAKRLTAFQVQLIGVDLIKGNSDDIQEFYGTDDLMDVLTRCDILILTLPLTDLTYHLIDADKIEAMKENSVLINVSRGAVIDEPALIDALNHGKLLGAALDVFEEEPLSADSPLWENNRVIITPHNSFESDMVRERLYELIWNNIIDYTKVMKELKGEKESKNIEISKGNKESKPLRENRKYKICIITTMSSSIDNWIKPFYELYNNNNFDVTIASNMSNEYIQEIQREYPFIHPVNINMPRGIHFIESVIAIWKLYQLFITEKFHFVQYSTPNASLYSAIASKLAGIPVRLYCQWGMVFVSMKGIKRFIFEFMERITCTLSTQIQPDSHGNLDYCRKYKFYSEKKSHVIWNGSAKGVDLEKFDITKKTSYRDEIMHRYGIQDGSIVLGFVGRLGRDKGCNELFLAFNILNQKYKNLKLLFVGPIEKEDSINPKLLKWFYRNKNIIKTNRVADVEKHMAAMDIFILPSYREGFGMSVVEAEAMGVPVIVTDIPGPNSAMIPNVTGLTVPVKNVKAIVSAVEQLINDETKRKAFGTQGRVFAESHFNSKVFAKKLIENRLKLMKGILKNESFNNW